MSRCGFLCHRSRHLRQVCHLFPARDVAEMASNLDGSRENEQVMEAGSNTGRHSGQDALNWASSV